MSNPLGYQRHRIDGLDLWVNPVTGRVWPHIRGAADDDGDGDEPRTFTQDEVDRIVGQARGEARRSAANELAAELGCTVEEAKAKIDALTAADNASKTEAERLLAQAQADAQSAAKDKADAAAERLAIRVEKALTAAKCNSADRAVRLLDIPADADDDTIAAQVDALKGDIPALFTETTGGPKPPASPFGGDRGRGKPPAAPKDANDRARGYLAAAGIPVPDNAA